MARPTGPGRPLSSGVSTRSATSGRADVSRGNAGRQGTLGAFTEVKSTAAMFDVTDIIDLGDAPLPDFEDWWKDEEHAVSPREPATDPKLTETSEVAPSRVASTASTGKRKRASGGPADTSKPPATRKLVNVRQTIGQPSRAMIKSFEAHSDTRNTESFQSTSLHACLLRCEQSSGLRQALVKANTLEEALGAMKIHHGAPSSHTTQSLIRHLGEIDPAARQQFVVMLLANIQQFSEGTLFTFVNILMPHLDATWDSEMEPIRTLAIRSLERVIGGITEIDHDRLREKLPGLDRNGLMGLDAILRSWKATGLDPARV